MSDNLIKKMNGDIEKVDTSSPVVIRKVDSTTDEIFILPKSGGCCRECGKDVDSITWKKTRPLCQRCWDDDGEN